MLQEEGRLRPPRNSFGDQCSGCSSTAAAAATAADDFDEDSLLEGGIRALFWCEARLVDLVEIAPCINEVTIIGHDELQRRPSKLH